MLKRINDPVAWLLFLFGVACILFSTGYVLAGDLDKMREQMFAVTAQLNGNCSSSLIYSDRDEKSGEVSTVFLTAKHCVAGEKSDMTIDIPVYQDNRVVKKDRYVARVMGEWYKGDLALVKLRDTRTLFDKPAHIAAADPGLIMGQDVWTVGYPLGMGLTVTKGLFGSLETNDFDKPGTEYFRATPDIAGGNSGGAMYRITTGGDYELIGVTAARARSDSFIGLYTSIFDIHEYLKVALPDAVKEPSKPPS